MNEEQRQKKHEILNKIAQLVKLASALGEDTEDEQTRFIAETFKLVMLTGSDADTAKMFSEHIIHFLNELEIQQGHKTVNEYLSKEAPVILN